MNSGDSPAKNAADHPADSPKSTKSGDVRKLGFLLLLFILPFLYLQQRTEIKQAWGEHWHAINYDPAYAYLFNGLNIATGKPPYHVDHPGTPVQMWTAILIRLGNLHSDTSQISENVIQDAPKWIDLSTLSIAWLVSAAILFAGVFVWMVNRNIVQALVMQSGFLLVPTFAAYSVRLDAEGMLVAIGTIFSATLIASVYCKPQKIAFFEFALGFIFAVAVATKITFLMNFLLIPGFLFRPERWKKTAPIVALGGTVGLALSLWPVFPELSRSMHFWTKIASRQGYYGEGSPGLPDWNVWLNSAIELLRGNIMVVLLAIAIPSILLVIAARSHFSKKGGGKENETTKALLLPCLSIFATIVVQTILVAKHPAQHYLLAGYPMAILGAALALGVLKNSLTLRHFAIASFGLVSLYFGFLLEANNRTLNEWAQIHSARKEFLARDLLQIATIEPGLRRSFYFGSSSPTYALHFGNGYSGNRYGTQLESIYPNQLNFVIWNHRFIFSTGFIVPGADPDSTGKFLFVGPMDSDALTKLLARGDLDFELTPMYDSTYSHAAVVEFHEKPQESPQ